MRAPCWKSHSVLQHGQLAAGASQVDQAVIDELHAAYYAEVQRLFEKHREGFNGYEKMHLAFSDG